MECIIILRAILVIQLSITVVNSSLISNHENHDKESHACHHEHGGANGSGCNCKCRQCPDVVDRCPYGTIPDTRDPRRCCNVCAIGVGDYCDPDADTFTEYGEFFSKWQTSGTGLIINPMSLVRDKTMKTKNRFGRCGNDMRCRPVKELPWRIADVGSMAVYAYLRSIMDVRGSIKTVCVCKDSDMVCGSDGITYDNRCLMKKAGTESKTTITEVEPGMCKGAPKLAMPPSDVVLRSGDRALLRCQFVSEPMTKVYWRRKGSLQQPAIEAFIPGDNARFVVHELGGPEKFMVTTILDILDVNLDDAAMYECRGSNMYGTTSGTASVFVKDGV
ncbi:insulin-like growth factor-binding protein 7 [Lytechinus pictus]|uniref:insulin-like growth factor-binding protein 7 n=1 Tax=Lytechinus pictus TaxID=7653 RepID=UPI0030B9FC80